MRLRPGPTGDRQGDRRLVVCLGSRRGGGSGGEMSQCLMGINVNIMKMRRRGWGAESAAEQNEEASAAAAANA